MKQDTNCCSKFKLLLRHNSCENSSKFLKWLQSLTARENFRWRHRNWDKIKANKKQNFWQNTFSRKNWQIFCGVITIPNASEIQSCYCRVFVCTLFARNLWNFDEVFRGKSKLGGKTNLKGPFRMSGQVFFGLLLQAGHFMCCHSCWKTK